MSTLIFCGGEGQEFSDEEFLHNKDGTLFEPAIHKKSPPHYATSGEAVTGSGTPIPGVLLAPLSELLQKMSVEDIRDWLVQKNEN
jgi:hypothetical protein